MTEQEYRRHVTTTARKIWYKSRAAPASRDTLIQAAVDCSPWVLFASRAQAVLQWSRNDDAIFAALGTEWLLECRCMGDIYLRAAAQALESDVRQEMEKLDEPSPGTAC